MVKIGRNESCPCGSGKKYKKCCMGKDTARANHPKVVTTGGEEVVFLEAHYDLKNHEQAIALLNAEEDFEVDDFGQHSASASEVSCVWLQRGESDRLLGYQPSTMSGQLNISASSRLLGDVVLTAKRLILHTVGHNRFAIGKRRLEAVLGSLVRHRLDSVQSLDSAMSAAEDSFAGQPPKPATISATDQRFAPLAEGETLEDAIQSRGFGGLDEINLFVDKVTQDYNNRPQTDLAGLSPVQIRRLLDADWEDERGPLRLDKSLSPDEVADTPLLNNVRLLVDQCESEGGAKVTSAGNLNRKTVAALIPLMDFMGDRLSESELQRRSVFNEQDISFLHLTRIIAGLAGIIRKYKGRFVPTKRGMEFMQDDKLPALYRNLFLTTFRKFNLGYNSRVGHPDIQSTITYPLHVLGKLPCDVWQDATEKHMADILLPAVRDRLFEASKSEYLPIIMKASVNNWILDPLSWFGLVETKEGKFFQIRAFRTTALYAKFITFQF